MSNMYQIVRILDVLYDTEAQYSSKWIINDAYETGKFISFKSVKDLCNQLKCLKFIESADLRKISVSSQDKDIIEVREKKTLKPLCRLYKSNWITR